MRGGGSFIAVCVCPAAFTALVGLAGLAGCMSGTEATTGDVSPEGWSRRIELTYDNTDTLTLRNLSLTLRHSIEVEPAEGLYVVGMVSPSGVLTENGVRVAVPVRTARAGRLSETTAPIRAGVRLDETGEWRLTVTPLQNVRGVWNVSITLNDRNGQR